MRLIANDDLSYIEKLAEGAVVTDALRDKATFLRNEIEGLRVTDTCLGSDGTFILVFGDDQEPAAHVLVVMGSCMWGGKKADAAA
jgi:hypothetical protein